MPVEIESGILWFQLPLPMALDHVNVYALLGDEGWTIVDTGLFNQDTRNTWLRIIDDHLSGAQLARVIITHHHPDHVGMAGWFKNEFGAELLASRTAWLTARMLTLDIQETPVSEAIEFFREAGITGTALEEFKRKRPFNFGDCVHHISPGFTRLTAGQQLVIGGHEWTVRLGDGHAPENVTLWRDDGRMLIGGDQFLATITPNIGVHPGEPEANPLAEWLSSCRRFEEIADNSALVLPGHHKPFRGLSQRLEEYRAFHANCLERLERHLRTPATAVDCFDVLFGRRITSGEFQLALAESVAHLNYLLDDGVVDRRKDADGSWLWYSLRGG